MKINYAVISKVGRRTNNEDAVRVVEYPDGEHWLGVVCDGMGGHSMGEVAAESVADAVCNYWLCCDDNDSEAKVAAACRAASEKLVARSSGLNDIQMGTTLVMASIKGSTITVAHCGDSRCYLMRGREAIYQTADHVDMHFGWESVTRCFFSRNPDAAVADVKQFEIESGDRVLLCSDGLYKSIAPEILKARIMDDKSPEEILDVFDFLCEKNGDDNYTAILAVVE